MWPEYDFERPRTPNDALHHAILKGPPTSLLLDRRRFLHRWDPKRPGEIIEKLPEEVRVLLRELRSSDVTSDKVLTWAAYMGEDSVQPAAEKYSTLWWERRYRAMLLEHDQKFFHLNP